MDSSIGRTFSSGVFQARNDIPNYNRFVFGVDYTEAFALALLKQEAPNLYQEYQDILAGNKTMKSKRTLDFTRQGKGVIKSIKSTPAVEAQQFLSQVSGQLLWSLLKIPVTLQTYDENGHLVTQDFALQRNQVNYVDEWICETGNIAAPYYSDNGITLIPLQLTNSSIYANLKRAIETGEWWSVVSQKIHFDIGAEKTDTNGKGEVKVYYMPPGENFIYSWSNLEMNQNANYSTPFAYADGKTAVWIKLSNRIGNNGEYQSVRNTIERVNTSNIVNSAGIIAILSNRRDQFGKNPCLEQIPNNILTSLDQIEQIVPDGSCRVTAVIQTRGDNPNSQADEVYRQIGRMLIDGEIATGDGSGGGQLNNDPNKPGQGILNINGGGLLGYGDLVTVGETRLGKITQAVDPFKKYLEKIWNQRHRRFPIPSLENLNSWNIPDYSNITALYGVTDISSLTGEPTHNTYSNMTLEYMIPDEPLFCLKGNRVKNYDRNNANIRYFGQIREYISSKIKGLSIDLTKRTSPIPNDFNQNFPGYSASSYLSGTKGYCVITYSNSQSLYYPCGVSLTQTFIWMGTGSTNENSSQQSSQPSIAWGFQPDKGILAAGTLPGNAASLAYPTVIRTIGNVSSKNGSLSRILNLSQISLNHSANPITSATNDDSTEVQLNTYQAQRLQASQSTTIIPTNDMPTSITEAYTKNSTIAQITGVPDGTVAPISFLDGGGANDYLSLIQDYASLFSTVEQSNTNPEATRYCVQFEATLSYNFWVTMAVSSLTISHSNIASFNFNPTYFTSDKLSRPLITVKYKVSFMACLKSVLNETISFDTLLKNSVKISHTEDWVSAVVNGDLQPYNNSEDTWLFTSGPISTDQFNLDIPLYSIQEYKTGAVKSFYPQLVGYVSGAIRISNGDLFYLPESLPSSSGEITVTSDTQITIYPVITCQVCVQPLRVDYRDNTNDIIQHSCTLVAIHPVNKSWKFDTAEENGVIFPIITQLSGSDGVDQLFSLNTISINVTQVDPMGNVPSSET